MAEKDIYSCISSWSAGVLFELVETQTTYTLSDVPNFSHNSQSRGLCFVACGFMLLRGRVLKLLGEYFTDG